MMGDASCGGDTETLSPIAAANRLQPGQVIKSIQLRAVDGSVVAVPDARLLTHLQYRRFAGCPVCNLHLHSFARRQGDIEAAGIREVVFFHSPEAELRKYVDDLPFAMIADPLKRYYRDFGVEAGHRALLNPRGWPKIARAVANGLREVISHGKPMPPLFPEGGRYGLPADFLIDTEGRVLAVKYGQHVDDQWSVDELLEAAIRPSRYQSGNESGTVSQNSL